MVNNKTDLSNLSKAVRQVILDNGHHIKLASVRERVAESFKCNSVNELLSRLPKSLTLDFWRTLPALLADKHDIVIPVLPWQIPFSEDYPLTDKEKETIWQCLCTVYDCLERADMQIPGSEIRPDGQGGWLFRHEIPWMVEEFADFSAKEDQQIPLQSDEYTLFELHLKAISTYSEGCDAWVTNSNYEEVHNVLEKMCDAQNVSIDALPAPLKRLETEYPLLGFDASMDNEELFYDDVSYELLDRLIEQGLIFDGKIHGHEQQLMSLGYYQLFFLAQPKNVPVIETPMVIGNFVVTLSKQTPTLLSESLHLKDKAILVCEDDVSIIVDDDIAYYESQRRFVRLSRPIVDEVINSMISTMQMVTNCVKDKEFPIFSIDNEQVDEVEERDLKISVYEEDGLFEISCLPLTYIIPEGHDQADGLIGTVSTLMSDISSAGGSARVNANRGDIYSDNVNAETVLSVIYQKDVKLCNHASPFGDHVGNLNPEIVATWLKKHGVVCLSANAFNSVYTGDWVYLSISGFDHYGERISVLGVSFYAMNECEQWHEWYREFQSAYGSRVHINETYEFTWHSEVNPHNDFVLPYFIPDAPKKVEKKFGLGCFAFCGAQLNGRIPLVLPDKINTLIFPNRELSNLPPFRITPLIAVPDGKNAFAFIKDAMAFAGSVDLSDDESWTAFMNRVFEFIVISMTQNSKMYAFIIAEGGDNTIQNILLSYLPTNHQLDWENMLMGEKSKPSQFNTTYSDEALREIEVIMNIRGAKGVNFATHSGKPH